MNEEEEEEEERRKTQARMRRRRRSERYSPARPVELLGFLGRNLSSIKLSSNMFPA